MCDRCWGYDTLHPCVCEDPGPGADAGDLGEAAVLAAAGRVAVFAGGGDEGR